MIQAKGTYFFILVKRGDFTIQYEISDAYDQSLSSFTGDYEYWGYLNTSGGWIIQQHQISTGMFRYIGGTSLYSVYWGNKGSLSYSTFDALFG